MPHIPHIFPNSAPVLRARCFEDPPERMKTHTDDLSPRAASSRPNQLTDNHIIREMARGKQQIPSYAPYIVPYFTDVPWHVPTAEHTATKLRWRGRRQSAKAPKNPQWPIQG